MQTADIEKLSSELSAAKGKLAELEARPATGSLPAFKQHRNEVADAKATVEWLQTLLHDAEQAREAESRQRKRAQLDELRAQLEYQRVRARLRPIVERAIDGLVVACTAIGEIDAAVCDLNDAHRAAFHILEQLDVKDPTIRGETTETYRGLAQGLMGCLRLLKVPTLPSTSGLPTELAAWLHLDVANAIRLAGGGSRDSRRSPEAQLREALGDAPEVATAPDIAAQKRA